MYLTIWEHRLKIFFAPPKSKKKRPPGNRKCLQKCEQFSYGTFGGIFLGFLVPLHQLASISWRDAVCYSILLGGGTNISPHWFPPIPIPRVAKVPCQGAEQIVRNIQSFENGTCEK